MAYTNSDDYIRCDGCCKPLYEHDGYFIRSGTPLLSLISVLSIFCCDCYIERMLLGFEKWEHVSRIRTLAKGLWQPHDSNKGIVQKVLIDYSK